MNHFRPFLTIGLLLVVLGLVLALSGRRVEAPAVEAPASTSTSETPEPSASGILVTDSFANGTHTYTFDLYLPTPCHSLSKPDVLIRESYPEQIVIAYTVVPPADGVMCVQVISRVTVSVDAVASAQAVLSSITLNSASIAFTVAAASY